MPDIIVRVFIEFSAVLEDDSKVFPKIPEGVVHLEVDLILYFEEIKPLLELLLEGVIFFRVHLVFEWGQKVDPVVDIMFVEINQF